MSDFIPYKKLEIGRDIHKNINEKIFKFINYIFYFNEKSEIKSKLYDEFIEIKYLYKDLDCFKFIFQVEGQDEVENPEKLLLKVRERVYDFLISEIQKSRPWLALNVVSGSWGSDKALSLLEAMPDDFCPGFIKKNYESLC